MSKPVINIRNLRANDIVLKMRTKGLNVPTDGQPFKATVSYKRGRRRKVCQVTVNCHIVRAGCDCCSTQIEVYMQRANGDIVFNDSSTYF